MRRHRSDQIREPNRPGNNFVSLLPCEDAANQRFVFAWVLAISSQLPSLMLVHPKDDDVAHPFLSSQGHPLLDSILLRRNRKSYNRHNPRDIQERDDEPRSERCVESRLMPNDADYGAKNHPLITHPTLGFVLLLKPREPGEACLGPADASRAGPTRSWRSSTRA
jgi:hypothetical protein